MLLGSSNGDHHHQQTSDGRGGDDGVQLKKGPWTAAEDAVLAEYVRKHGEGNWNAVQRNTGLARCGKSCRLRWANHLRPNLKKGAFSPEEERLIIELHAQLGNKWARMAAQLPGRTDNEIKNYWNTRVKRRHRQGMPLYPPEIQAQHQHQRIHLNHHHRSSHSHHSYHSQPTTPTTPTSSFSFPIASNSPTTPTGHHHHHHFPPQSYSRSPNSSLPPTPPSLSPGFQSPHQPAFPTLTLFDTNNNNNNISSGGGAFNLLRIPPQLQNPPRFKRFHSDSIVTFSGHYNDSNNNIMSNNNYSFNSGNNGFHGGTCSSNNCSVSFSPFLRNSSSPSVLTSPTSNCNIPAAGFVTATSSSSSSKLLSFPSFSQMPVSFDNQHLPLTFYRTPDEKDCILTSTGSGFNLKQELPSSQIMGFENEKLSLSTSTGSGLLEDLLEQTQAGNYGESSTRASDQDNKSNFSGFNQWSESSCMNISSGLEAKEETAGLINVPEDISKLLNGIPSEQVPDWYTDSGEASNCQSSVVTDANLGLEMHQLASIFCVDPAAAGHVTAPGSCSNYDNLPGIC